MGKGTRTSDKKNGQGAWGKRLGMEPMGKENLDREGVCRLGVKETD